MSFIPPQNVPLQNRQSRKYLYSGIWRRFPEFRLAGHNYSSPPGFEQLYIDHTQQEWKGYLIFFFYLFNSSQVTAATMRVPINHIYDMKGLGHTTRLRKRVTSTNSHPQLIWPERTRPSLERKQSGGESTVGSK